MTTSLSEGTVFRKALSWSVGGELVTKLIQPMTFIILAAILTPADLGVVTSAMVIISFCEIFWQAGVGKALIQTNDNVSDAADAAFWINITVAMLLIVALLLFSEFIGGGLFSDPRVANVIRWLCLYIAFGAMASVPLHLLQRQMRFKEVFYLRLIAALTPLAMSVPLALAGLGYWSIVVGTVVGQALQTVSLYLWKVYRPSLSVSGLAAKRLTSFSAWVGGSALLSWFYAWGDSLIIGAYLTSHEVGIYRTASMTVAYFYGALFIPLLPVIYSRLARTHQRGESIHSLFAASVRLIARISIPLSCLIYLAAPLAESALFSERWSGLGFVASHLALMVGFSTVVSANGEAYRAIGKPHLETLVTGAMLILYLAGYIIAVRHGLTTFVYARVGLAAMALAVHLALAQATGILSMRDSSGAFLASIAAGISALLVYSLLVYIFSFPSSLLKVSFLIFATLSSVATLLILQGRAFRSDVRTLFQAPMRASPDKQRFH